MVLLAFLLALPWAPLNHLDPPKKTNANKKMQKLSHIGLFERDDPELESLYETSEKVSPDHSHDAKYFHRFPELCTGLRLEHVTKSARTNMVSLDKTSPL